MPADGEWKFSDYVIYLGSHEYRTAKQSQCFKSAFANGFMLSAAGYLMGYLYTYNRKKAFYVFGAPTFIFATLITGAVCNWNKAKAMK